MTSKGALGLSYLYGTSLGLLVSLTGYFALAQSDPLVALLGSLIGLVIAGSLAHVGYWLQRHDFDDAVIWRVAQSSAVGLAIPTFIGVLLTVVGVGVDAFSLLGTLLVTFVVIGALGGVLVGLVAELRKEHRETQLLLERNAVLTRLLRHAVRRETDGLAACVSRLEATETDPDVAEPIRETLEDVVALSEAAGTVETLESAESAQPVDVATIARERVALRRAVAPGVAFEVAAPEEAWVAADPVLRSIVDGLLEDAIDRCPPDGTVEVAVRDAEERVTLGVGDDGPGIPARHRQALEAGPDAEHLPGTGLGLWLAKWFAESYDGAFVVEDREPTGTAVRVSFPAVAPPPVP